MITFVYFDIGGVVIKDFSNSTKWEQMNQEMGVNQTNHAAFKALWQRYQDRIDLDQDIDNLVPLLRSEVGLHLPDNFSWLNELVDRFLPNYSLWPVIQEVQKTAKIGLLTNMYPRMLPAIQGSGLLPPVHWEVVLDSSILQIKKPEQKIYELAQQQAKVSADQILFVDNKAENLEVPNQLGWHTFLYNSADYENSSHQLEEYFQSL